MRFLFWITSLLLVSCQDDRLQRKSVPIQVTVSILDEAGRQPIENVELIAFVGGVYQGNNTRTYGRRISLGFSDKCGKIKIILTDSIKGFGTHGLYDSTIVVAKLDRQDYGSDEVFINYKSHDTTLRMDYNPARTPFFDNIFFVQSEDGTSVDISWKVYSLSQYYDCPIFPGSDGTCINSSNGYVYVQRSDRNDVSYTIPIQLGIQQSVRDKLLPLGNFSYNIYPGDNRVTIFSGDVERTNFDTVFIVKSLKYPILNHCN